MMVKAFVQIHSSVNLTEERRRGRNITEKQHPGALDRSGVIEEQPINFMFSLEEMKRAISNQVIHLQGKIRFATSC